MVLTKKKKQTFAIRRRREKETLHAHMFVSFRLEETRGQSRKSFIVWQAAEAELEASVDSIHQMISVLYIFSLSES